MLPRHRLAAVAALLAAALAPRGAGALGETKLIIDTDMSTDVDDVVALCIAHKLQDRGEAEILAVVHNTGLPMGIGAVSVINHYYGRNDIPLGAYKGPFDNPTTMEDAWVMHYSAGPYVTQLVKEFSAPIKSSAEVPGAVEVYRKVLASQEDSSVVVASLGFLNNLASLLDSKPDHHSPLTGRQLVETKVREVAVMGGRYPGSIHMHYEWNFGGGCQWGSDRCPDAPAWTKAVVDGWPRSVPMTFSGFELGERVLTGADIKHCASSQSPCRAAMEFYQQADPECPPRPSWDPMTVLYAVRGVERWGERQRGGHNKVNGTDGANSWVDGPPTHQSYLALKPGKEKALAREIDSLLCDPPESFKYV